VPVDPFQQAINAASFGQVADLYARSRPSYPPQAVDWLLPDGARRVLDLGAGTGKLTAELFARGLDVAAVEPSAEMLAELSNLLPQVPALVGTAEQIPFPDDSFECVLVAQAWHWVDPAKAVPEVARVLRRGGRLGLVWNERDERVAWVAELSRLLGDEFQPERTTSNLGSHFGEPEYFETSWTQSITGPGLVDLIASRSYVITAAPHRRAELLAQVQQLLDRHPDLAGRQTFPLPYVTRCYRFHLDEKLDPSEG
jgi:SAM-dependent methyltransferase